MELVVLDEIETLDILMKQSIPIISPGLIFLQKAFLLGLLSGAYFRRGLLLERRLFFKMGWQSTDFFSEGLIIGKIHASAWGACCCPWAA